MALYDKEQGRAYLLGPDAVNRIGSDTRPRFALSVSAALKWATWSRRNVAARAATR
ncbi:MAG: hypothetical protein LBS56_02135 [Propionibacteriaceae bacterium]|nr:hypothetical protein [Propionibacteriaceae bacterium]